MTIPATFIAYYHTCKRKLWLHAHEIRMEHTSDTVYEGKLVGETTYTDRPAKGTQLELSVPLNEEWTATAKIDYYDAKTKIVYETKKSSKIEEAHLAQVKFYLYLLTKSGIQDAQGIIEYPKQRDRTQVIFTPKDQMEIEKWIAQIQLILAANSCPPVINKTMCKQCSYYDFCYANEEF